MIEPRGHPYGENIRCHPSEAWPAPRETRSDAVDAELHRPPSWLSEQEAKAAEHFVGDMALSGDPVFPKARIAIRLDVDGASGDASLEMRVASEFRSLFALFKDRQRKYGPANIAAFGDSGVCVRAHDKLARLRHHYFAGGAGDMPDESVDDAWRDLAVYAVIALVCREGGWPGWDKGAKP